MLKIIKEPIVKKTYLNHVGLNDEMKIAWKNMRNVHIQGDLDAHD